MSVFTRCDFWSFIVSCRLMCPPQSVVFIVLACFHVLRYIIQQSPTNEPYIRVSTSLPNRPAIHSSKSFLLSPFLTHHHLSSMYMPLFISLLDRRGRISNDALLRFSITFSFCSSDQHHLPPLIFPRTDEGIAT